MLTLGVLEEFAYTIINQVEKLTFRVSSCENIFWFYIAVKYWSFMNSLQDSQHLVGYVQDAF